MKEEIDSLYQDAVEEVLKGKTASISKLQRVFKIGYNRAARLIDAMEYGGILLPMNSKGVREVIKQPIKKKAASKKKAAKKKIPSKKPPQKPVKKKAAVPKKKKAILAKSKGPGVKIASKKKAAVKKVRARDRNRGPVPKYHINHQEWNKMAAMEAICLELISTSYGLSYICRNNNELPSQASVFLWLNEEERGTGEKPLLEMYARAKEMQVEYSVDEMYEIADDGSNDYITKTNNDGSEYEVVNTEHIQRSKLRIDTRKWTASKLKNRKYGDKLQLSNDPENPFEKSTDEDLLKQIAVLTEKMKQPEESDGAK